MTGWIWQALPSLEALGDWSYWILGAAALLQSFFVTGIVVPGTLAVLLGGALLRAGLFDATDLVWFVTLGAALGGALGYATGRLLADRLSGSGWQPRWDAYRPARALVQRRGGAALLLGRVRPSLAGLAALAAARAGMPPGRFLLWDLAGALAYALVVPAIGYAAAALLAQLAQHLPRAAVAAMVLVAALAAIWLVAAQLRRGLPLLLSGAGTLRDLALARPRVQRLTQAHPRLWRLLAARFDTARFSGLALTALVAVVVYLVAVWIDSALDYLTEPQVAATDLRLAHLLHAFWNPALLRAFGLVTQLGHSPVVWAALVGAVAALAVARRPASVAQLLVALGGELLSVRLLKGAFARPRPDLGYFVETSGSFPSGHATLSVAFWGTLCVILWRERVIGPLTALVAAAVLAFLIGASRLYLIEHYLSDVLNGWLLGGLWLAIGFGVAEALRARWRRPPPPGPARASLAAGLALVATAVAVWQVLAADPPRAVAAAPAEPAVIRPEALAGHPGFPLTVESLDGDDSLPVTLVLTAPWLTDVEAALRQAGWRQVDRRTPGGLLDAAWADWTGGSDPAAPPVPLFWHGRPQDDAWRSPDGRTDLRLWQAGAVTPEGLHILPAVLSGARPDRSPADAAVRDALLQALHATAGPQLPVAPQQGRAPQDRRWQWSGPLVVARLGAAAK